jgi:hypothetical protein
MRLKRVRLNQDPEQVKHPQGISFIRFFRFFILFKTIQDTGKRPRRCRENDSTQRSEILMPQTVFFRKNGEWWINGALHSLSR